ncbi:MAG: hypothetical protein OIN87_03820 [Candidatus Methanoperedens sp.]|nr:hypothetical protein [Candidatus Methanoperedens sp.]
MKANRTNLLNNDTGDVGIGTLIIFIAMVLVAAVAAAVLIQTSGVLQQKAQATGKEATAEVSSNMKIVSIIGERASSADDISTLRVYVENSAGGGLIDSAQVSIRYIDSLGDTLITATNYTEERSIATDSSDTVLSPGELAYFEFTPTNDLKVREKATIQIIPEVGSMIIKEVKAPASFGMDISIQLFP